MAKESKAEKAAAKHKAGGPYKSAEEAIKSPTYSAMHKARKFEKEAVRKEFQSPQTGKLKGRMEHTYKEDSVKGHKVMKKFGGAGYQGKQPESMHVLDLKRPSKRQGTSDGYMVKSWRDRKEPMSGASRTESQQKSLKKSMAEGKK